MLDINSARNRSLLSGIVCILIFGEVKGDTNMVPINFYVSVTIGQSFPGAISKGNGGFVIIFPGLRI